MGNVSDSENNDSSVVTVPAANIALFVTFVGDAVRTSEVDAWFRGEPLSFLRSCPEVVSVDTFVPDAGDVPRFEDGTGPPLIAQIDVASPAHAQKLLASDAFSELIMQPAAYPACVERILLDVFETIHCPITAQSTPPPLRSAPLSFVVRYYRPVEDEADFIAAYMSDHPPLMTGFPNIRNIICYVPSRMAGQDRFPNSGAFFGNEVVFDDLRALNNALASDVLPKLKAGRNSFIPFGFNTHYAMRREQVYARR